MLYIDQRTSWLKPAYLRYYHTAVLDGLVVHFYLQSKNGYGILNRLLPLFTNNQAGWVRTL